MATHPGPARASDHPGDVSATTSFPDPFPALPAEPYQSARSTRNDTEYTDPPTDPAMPALDDPYPGGAGTFDPFAFDAYRPAPLWYRKPSALIALAAIALAVGAVLVAAFLLLSGRWTVGGPASETSPTPTPTTDASTPTPTPTTTPQTSPPPPPPPPPPPENEAPANPRNTYAPAPGAPRAPQDNRRNVTTPQTRPPDVSVRPTHRPAFPGQPGEQ